MRRRSFVRTLEGVVVGFPLIFACSDTIIAPDLDVNRYSFKKDNIQYQIQTDKYEYLLEQNVRIIYRITNIRDEDVTFPLELSYPIFPCRFIIEKDGNEIYCNNCGPIPAVYLPTDYSFTLKPLEYKEFVDNWDMKDNQNNLVDPGIYEVIGHLLYKPHHEYYVPVSVSIEIK